MCLLFSKFLVFYVIFMDVLDCLEPMHGCHLPAVPIYGYLRQPGDLVIGGTFPVHVDRSYTENTFTSKPEDLKCKLLELDNYQRMQAMIYAIEEINKNPGLLPNITLGYQIFDTCTVLRRAIEGTLWMLSGGKESIPNYQCEQTGTLAGIVGDSASTRSILMAHVLGLYRYPQVQNNTFLKAELWILKICRLYLTNDNMIPLISFFFNPQISYSSTSPTLSNRKVFPSFFRTIPSDVFQSRGLANLILYFGWSWVGFLASDNDYGQLSLQAVKQELINSGACVAFIETIMTGQANRNAPHIVKVIKGSTAKVVAVLASKPEFLPVVEELAKQNVTDIIWIASEAWSTSNLLSKEKYQHVLMGTLGFAVHAGQLPGFMEYLNSLHPSKAPNDLFIIEFWEQLFSCRWINHLNLDDRISNKTAQDCTGEEKLGKSMLKVDFGATFMVYTSVYAFAWALQNLLHCQKGQGPFHNGCANILSFDPWQVRYLYFSQSRLIICFACFALNPSLLNVVFQLLHYIKRTRFQTTDKTNIFFDDNGDPPALYDIVNWQISSTGSLEQVIVGRYDSSSTDENIMSLNHAGIVWVNNKTMVPPSKCSSSCSPGFMKVAISGKPICCFQCVPCPQGQISNETDAVNCHPCPWDMWHNLRQDACLPRPIEFLSYSEALGMNLATIAIFSSVVPLGILGLFIHYRTTPIVRANNWSLSCLLLISLCLCFLCSLAFIGYPQIEKCLLRQVTFGLAFSLCISCVLAKTITVVIAFKATMPGSQLRKFTGVRVSYSLIVFCLLIQVSICVTWLSSSPPFPEFDSNSQSGVIILSCNEGSPTAFWFMLGYLGLLATISFIVAFLARRLPDSFNEAKFITFSMLAFLSVWISYIPASLSSRGKYTVATEIFAILSSSWALVVCIFLPKCFIILFRPDMNSKGLLIKKNYS
ncbi:extracellular calcium-sensing receptor-like [Rana temporaria]|uniref:extracellular calcium-sensing receptor-like n=1 Tax=Rana temporaria TaxID=8407 RepID=UPI001AAD6272|nr:extracellular calcium-sensing receptor-like [Rana temporaria]